MALKLDMRLARSRVVCVVLLSTFLNVIDSLVTVTTAQYS
jgi:hypothetical protein